MSVSESLDKPQENRLDLEMPYVTSSPLTEKEKNLYTLIDSAKEMMRTYFTHLSREDVMDRAPSHPRVLELTKLNNQVFTNPSGDKKTGRELCDEVIDAKVFLIKVKAYQFLRPQLDAIKKLRNEIVPLFKHDLLLEIRRAVTTIREAWEDYLPKETERTPLKDLGDRKTEIDRYSTSLFPRSLPPIPDTESYPLSGYDGSDEETS